MSACWLLIEDINRSVAPPVELPIGRTFSLTILGTEAWFHLFNETTRDEVYSYLHQAGLRNFHVMLEESSEMRSLAKDIQRAEEEL